MSNKEEFRFPEEGETTPANTAPGFPEESGDPEEWQDEKKLRKALSKAERKKKGTSTRILLLVLLLVLLAGVYFFMGVPQSEPPPSPPTAVKKQPIAVPPPPAREKTTVAAPPVEPEPGVELEAEAEPPAETDAAAKISPAGGAPETGPAGKVEPMAVEEEPPAVAAATAPEASPSPESGAYVVHAGAFLFKANLASAMDKLVRMGFEPRVEQGKKQVVMTRLRLGNFAPEEAEARLTELSRVAPGVFSLPRGEEVVVYAGSYYNLDKARRFADQLYKQGVRLEEETVELEVPLYLLGFGAFSHLDAAREAAVRARETGLDAYVVKKG